MQVEALGRTLGIVARANARIAAGFETSGDDKRRCRTVATRASRTRRAYAAIPDGRNCAQAAMFEASSAAEGRAVRTFARGSAAPPKEDVLA